MTDTAKAEKLAAAKRRVEQMKKKKGTVKRENDVEDLKNQDQRDTGALHPNGTLSKSESSVPEQSITLDDSISIQDFTSDSAVTLVKSMEYSDNESILPRSVEEHMNTGGSGNFRFSDSREQKMGLHSTAPEHAGRLILEKASPNLLSIENTARPEPTKASIGCEADSVANGESPEGKDSELDEPLISGKHIDSYSKKGNAISKEEYFTTNDTSETPQTDIDNLQEIPGILGNPSITEIPGQSLHELKNSGGNNINSSQEVNIIGKESSEQDSFNSKTGLQVRILERACEQAKKECLDLRARLAAFENENQSLRNDLERMRKFHSHDVANESLDELKNETHEELVKKIRKLENEILELRCDIRHEPQKIKSEDSSALTSPGAKFTEVDLGTEFPSRSRPTNTSRGSLGTFFTNGLIAITGANNGTNDDGDLLDELIEFDEEAFRKAKEKEANLRNERIKNVKRSLSRWEGWMIDLVESRVQFDDGFGPIFEI